MSREREDRNTPFLRAYEVEYEGDPGTDLLNFLSRAPIRVKLLANLRRGNPPEEGLDASKGGISGNLSELEEKELISEDPVDGYRLTPLAELLLDDFFELKSAATDVRKIQMFLQDVPSWESELGSIVDQLTDARVVMETITNPRRPVTEYKKLVADAGRIREFVPFRFGIGNDFWRSQVVEGDLEGEFINSTDPTHITGQLRELWEDMYDTGQAQYWHHGPGLPFAMTIVEYDDCDREDRCFLAVNESRFILVESTSADVIRWAEATFEQYKQESKSVDPYAIG